ncbi:MAG: DMT family transporter [Bacteroidota bacterium]
MEKERYPGTILLAVIACLLWSSAFAGIKLGLPYTTPLHFAGVRFFISGLLVLPLALLRNPGFLRSIGKYLPFILLLSFVQTFLQYALFYTGISRVPGALGAIVIGSGPLFVALVAHFTMPGDRLTKQKIAGLSLGIAGIVLVSLGRNSGITFGNAAMFGVLILLANNLLSGISNVMIAREKRAVPPLVLSSFSMMIGGATLFLVSLPLEGWTPGPKPTVYYLSLGWLSILSAVAISIWTILLKRPGVKVSDLNFWKFLIPVAGAILAWLLLEGESPDLLTVSGMLVTAMALILVNRGKKAGKSTP